MTIPVFYGTAENGKIKLDKKDLYQLWVDSLAGEVEVSVGKRRKGRSLEQNKWYWACVVKIPADHFGYSSEEMHAFYRSMFLKKEIDFKGKKIEIVLSTTSLSTIEFSEYVEKCRNWAANEGLVIPDPNEIKFN